MNYNEIFQDVIATLISGGIAFIISTILYPKVAENWEKRRQDEKEQQEMDSVSSNHQTPGPRNPPAEQDNRQREPNQPGKPRRKAGRPEIAKQPIQLFPAWKVQRVVVVSRQPEHQRRQR